MTDLDSILDAAFEAATGRAPSARGREVVRVEAVADRRRHRRIRRLIYEGFGVDDVRVKTGASHLTIWGALKQAHRFHIFRPHQRIALIRASYERGLRSIAA